jgi:hypothetical protein
VGADVVNVYDPVTSTTPSPNVSTKFMEPLSMSALPLDADLATFPEKVPLRIVIVPPFKKMAPPAPVPELELVEAMLSTNATLVNVEVPLSW